jgi:hypothetical protein
VDKEVEHQYRLDGKVLPDWKKRKNTEEVEEEQQKKMESSGVGMRADKAETGTKGRDMGVGMKSRRGRIDMCLEKGNVSGPDGLVGKPHLYKF